MGLSLSHCNANWSYSGFMDFREELWSKCGFVYGYFESFLGPFCEMDQDHELYPFFSHSDWGGELSVEEIKNMLPKLKELIFSLEDGYNKYAGKEMIKGMEKCVELNEPMEFY